MQKKAVVLALASLVSGGAIGQSNVTVYGIADAAYVYSKGKTAAGDAINFSGIQSGGWSSSRLGFKGEESLGNGLKSVFLLEFGTNVDSNSALSSTRQSYLGLGGSLGTVTLGRQYAPSFPMMGRNGANDVTGVFPMNAFSPSFETLNKAETSRWNNSIAYLSNNYSGFQARVVYGFGEKTAAGTSTTDDGKLGVGLSYTNGPFNIDGIYQEIFDRDGKNDIAAYYVGAGYDFKVFKIVASYQQEKNELGISTTPSAANYGEAYKTKLWSVGTIIPVSSAGKIRAEYARISYDWGGDAKSTGWGLGYTHALSKRTDLYAEVSRISNGDASRALGWISSTRTVGQASSNFMLGMRHTF